MIFKLFLVFSQLILVNLNYQYKDPERRYKLIYPYDLINKNVYNYYNQQIGNLSQLEGDLNVWIDKSFLRPQSFSVLMNFRHDGQQSLILMDQQSIFWYKQTLLFAIMQISCF